MKEINRNDELSSNEKGLGLKCEIPIDENKRKLKDAPNRDNNEKYKMNHGATMERMKKHLPKERQKDFEDGVASGSNPKVKLIPRGENFYRTGRTDGGSYFTKEHPGKTSGVRKENLQLPPGNDGKELSKVCSTRPQIGIQSNIKLQPEWAKEAGYKVRPGMKQIYVPSANEHGALADNRFDVKKNNNSRNNE